MSDDKDPQRISDAADNCEVLRARLAKYEDAEGRPLQPAADLARRIDQAITEFTSGRACMHVPPRDTDVDIVLSECLKLANALESQAREIERWKGWAQANWNEFADGMKTQPSGVVLSDEELWSIRNQVAIHQVLRDDDSVKICVKHGRAIEQAVLARLNSSPVSAGDYAQYPPCDYCAEQLNYHPWHGSGLINGVESRHIHACDKCRHLLPAVSAGVVDERAAFESAIEASGGMRPGNYSPEYDRYVSERRQGQYEGWKLARAALSAPSHGEQVRDGWQMVPVEPNEAIRDAINLLCDDHSAFEDSDAFWSYLLAAAPSAGSQGGDV